MNLFGIKSRRTPARAVLARTASWIGGAGVGALPRSWEEQVRAAYCANPVAQRVCRIVAEAVGGAPLVADDTPGGAAALALIGAQSGGQALLATVATQMLLHGNAYIQLIASDESGPLSELFALRPERVVVETDGRGWPLAFAYRAGSQTIRLPAEDGRGRVLVAHVKAVHPLDDHYGLGNLSAAARAVAVHNAAAVWNQALLDNAARPSGALVYDPGERGAALSPEQFDRLKAEMEAQFQGSANAGRPMLLEGGLSWQAMSLSPADMDFIALKDSAARDIALAFGVPPMLAGLSGDATYANYREASRALWRLTVLPLAGTILGAINQALASWGMDAGLRVDPDRVTALSEDRERLWARVSAADFLNDAEKRAMLGLSAVTDDRGAAA
ncbi:phage portal protein [Sphingomonas lacunae]|uniref:Phage portal protein n=1 Tax=Sphingomonas lacunae TaxID=2698828 RepID=A0A6M4AUH2_9SPHN|nr:phage portal protein [Sphingomonas lacunae]QJQ32376.1 phage portal protein [Sphingomonas lacunae]